jgi:hypothetical protein
VPPASPIPDLPVVLQQILQFIGLNPFFIAVMLTAFAVESWYSGARLTVRTATAVGGAVTRGGAWLYGQPPVRRLVAVVTTVAVVIVQLFMIRLSYIGGSIVARWHTA